MHLLYLRFSGYFSHQNGGLSPRNPGKDAVFILPMHGWVGVVWIHISPVVNLSSQHFRCNRIDVRVDFMHCGAHSNQEGVACVGGQLCHRHSWFHFDFHPFTGCFY